MTATPGPQEDESPWYEKLRGDFRPDSLRVVFVGESAPDPGAGSKRFFYSDSLTHDNLFRGLMLALYDVGKDELAGRKVQWLQRFQQDGFWLVDVAERPINHLSPRERQRIRREAAPRLAQAIADAHPSHGVVVCHAATFEDFIPAARQQRLRVLHDEPIRFPLGNWRRDFVGGVRRP